MTVAELRAALEDVPGDWTVVLSRDREGNGFSPLHDCAIGLYESEPEILGHGDFVREQDLGPTDDEWCANALSLWPLR